jgi:hypothetical protein
MSDGFDSGSSDDAGSFGVVSYFTSREEAEENLRLGFYRREICEYLGVPPHEDDADAADVVTFIGAAGCACGIRCRGASEPASGKFCIFVHVGRDDPLADAEGNRDYDAEPIAESGAVDVDSPDQESTSALNLCGGKWRECWWGAFASERLALEHRLSCLSTHAYEVLATRDDVLRRMTARMQKLALLLFESACFEVEPAACAALLRANEWDPHVVAERYFVDNYGPSLVDRVGRAVVVDWAVVAAANGWDVCPTCQTTDEGRFVHLGVVGDAMCVECWGEFALAALNSDGHAMLDMRRAGAASAADDRTVSDEVWSHFLAAAPEQWERFVSRAAAQYVAACATTLSCVANPRAGCACHIELPAAAAAAAKERPDYYGVECACSRTFCASCALLSERGGGGIGALALAGAAAATAPAAAASSVEPRAKRRCVQPGASVPGAPVAPAAVSFAALGTVEGNHGDHRPATCAMVASWLSETREGGGSGELSEAWIRANSKPCPKCAVLITRERGCLEMDCNSCHTSFCYACGMHGALWKKTHYEAVADPSKFRCPVTEERRAAEAAAATGARKRSAARQLEAERVAKAQREQSGARDAAVSFRRIVCDHLLGVSGSGGSSGAIALRKAALLGSGRAAATLRFLDDAATEAARCCDVLAWTPVYIHYRFLAAAGGERSREAALVLHSAAQLTRQTASLVRLVGVDRDGDARVSPLSNLLRAGDRSSGGGGGDSAAAAAAPPGARGRRATDFVRPEERVLGQDYVEWRESTIARTASLRKACELHVKSARETCLDAVVDVAKRAKDERRWKAARAWMAQQRPKLRERDIDVGASAAAGGGGAAAPLWLRRLRALEERDPMRPWEALVDADVAVPEPLWSWGGVGQGVKWTPYGFAAQKTIEACFERMMAAEAHSAACVVSSAGCEYEVTVRRDGSGAQRSTETNMQRVCKREMQLRPVWICPNAECRIQNKAGTIVCYQCHWNRALECFSPGVPATKA